MRRAARLITISLLLLAGALAAAWRLSWRSPPFYELAADSLPVPLLSDASLDSVYPTVPQPYILECAAGTGAVLLYGAKHTRDPNDPQIADLLRRAAAFNPTFLLVEGRPGAPLAALGDPVRKFGEAGVILRLAHRDDIPIWTWEPSREAEVRAQLARFPAERVALYYVLRPYVSSRRFGRPDNPDAVVEETRRERTRWPGLEGTVPSMPAVDSLWRRDFAGLPDWRDTSDEHGWPGYLGEIFAASNRIRDEHFGRILFERMGRGDRVLAVAGSSHAVRLEPALAAGCAQPPRVNP